MSTISRHHSNTKHRFFVAIKCKGENSVYAGIKSAHLQHGTRQTMGGLPSFSLSMQTSANL